MNLETKKINKRLADDYLKFGWKISSEEKHYHRGGGTVYAILTRDMDMANYALISALEKKYFYLKSQIKTYEPVDPLNVILFFCLLIFPCVIYLSYKSNQKREIESKNNKLNVEMRKLVNEAKDLL